MGGILFPFFMLATFILFAAPIAGICGYDCRRKEWAHGLAERALALATGLAYGAIALGFLLAYVWLLGMPEPE